MDWGTGLSVLQLFPSLYSSDHSIKHVDHQHPHIYPGNLDFRRICFVVHCHSFQSWYRLRHIPGPFFARISYFWHVYAYALRGKSGPLYEDIHNRYANGGPFVVIAPKYVVTNDPEVLRHVAALRQRNPYTRDDWWKGGRFHPEYENLVCIIDNDEHDKLKAKTASGYSGRETGSQFEPAIDEQIAALTSLLRRKFLSSADTIRPVNISTLMRYFTLDVITRLGYGKSFGHLAEGEDVVGWVSGIDPALRYMSLILDVPWLRSILFSPLGLRLFGPKETDASGPGRVQGIIRRIVSERLDQHMQGDMKAYNDMIGGFIRNGLTAREIEGEANLQILAGSDTSSNTLCSAIVHLATTPHAYARFKRIVHDTVTSGAVSEDKPISFEQASKIPYLQAIVWEALRMRFPVNYGNYKSVPPGGDTIMGVFLPGGTAIGHNSLALTRNANIFGKDVHLFRPERFIEGGEEEGGCDAETAKARVRAIDVLFGGGRWTCSGKQIAMFELNKAIFEVSDITARGE